MRSEKFGSQRKRKSKTYFFTFLNVYASWIKRDKILISQPMPPKFTYFADQHERKADPMKMNFGNFQIQKWISQAARAQIVDQKNLVICLISFFLSWVMVLKLSKIVHFLQIFADLSKNPKCIKEIYFYVSERPYRVLSEKKVSPIGFIKGY